MYAHLISRFVSAVQAIFASCIGVVIATSCQDVLRDRYDFIVMKFSAAGCCYIQEALFNVGLHVKLRNIGTRM